MIFPRIQTILLAGIGLVSLGLAGCPYPDTTRTDTLSPVDRSSPASVYQPVKEVPYVPTPTAVVDEMLRVARVNENDVVYDLGSGDGRIVIAAARTYGARGVGVEIDPDLVRRARENARRAGVSDRVEFIERDLFETDLSEATVVTLYLLTRVNLRLRSKLLSELRPGTRIVSHEFDMGDWQPQRVVQVDNRTIYYWIVPERNAERSP